MEKHPTQTQTGPQAAKLKMMPSMSTSVGSLCCVHQPTNRSSGAKTYPGLLGVLEYPIEQQQQVVRSRQVHPDQEPNEVRLVMVPHAVGDPRTVMVQLENARLALPAVMRPGRLVVLARLAEARRVAPLLHLHPVHLRHVGPPAMGYVARRRDHAQAVVPEDHEDEKVEGGEDLEEVDGELAPILRPDDEDLRGEGEEGDERDRAPHP